MTMRKEKEKNNGRITSFCQDGKRKIKKFDKKKDKEPE